MAIPNTRPVFDVRAKVRVGEKRKTRDGKKEFPASVDYFVCDDPQFAQLAGDKPKELTILLPFQRPEDNFSTGLEQWAGQMLVCYTKGEQLDGRSVAFRRSTMKKGGRDVNLLDGFNVLSDRVVGNERREVECLDRNCPLMKAKDGCKPMGRLQFFLLGANPANGVYQLDTKSWNTIEKIEGFLSVFGDPRGRPLKLRVEMWSKGTSKFPVVSLEGFDVEIGKDGTVDDADSYVALRGAVERGDETEIKVALARVLDKTNPGWREREDFVARIREVGAKAAAEKMLERMSL